MEGSIEEETSLARSRAASMERGLLLDFLHDVSLVATPLELLLLELFASITSSGRFLRVVSMFVDASERDRGYQFKASLRAHRKDDSRP